MKTCYVERTFTSSSQATIDKANAILEEYVEQGFDLTLRQLYYQFVSRGLIPNKDSEYKKLGSVINDARLAGLIDWDHITDRTRNLRALAHWNSPRDIVNSCAAQFRFDKWEKQEDYVEVWVEKDALVGVLEVACTPLDVPFFSCRGYTSQSEMWAAGMRLLAKARAGKRVHIIHLGDHDPSGIDMSRDIEDRLKLFLAHHLIKEDFTETAEYRDYGNQERLNRAALKFYQAAAGTSGIVQRIALNMNQIREYDPPPNPAKLTDSRATDYIAKFGNESWELDALEPRVLTELIEQTVSEFRDDDLWYADVQREEKAKAKLKAAAEKL